MAIVVLTFNGCTWDNFFSEKNIASPNEILEQNEENPLPNEQNQENISEESFDKNQNVELSTEQNLAKDHYASDDSANISEKSDNIVRVMEDARESQKKVKLQLKKIVENEKEVAVKIMLYNPDQAKIVSLRSFIAYNPDILTGDQIIINQNSAFDLIAPNEDSFDNFMGVAKIGLSTTKEFIDDIEVEIAQVSFARNSKRFTTLDFFDARDNGHTEVLGHFSGHLINLLSPPETPAVIFSSLSQK